MGKIIVIPIGSNFLKTVASQLLDSKDPTNTTVVFPNRRAILFFQYYISKMIKKPAILPRLKALEDWILELYVLHETNPRIPINEYDQAWIVYQAARKVLEVDGNVSIVSSWEEFLPWAFRLVNLFKECDLEFTTPNNIQYPENVPKRAQVLLERIGKIYEMFTSQLNEQGYTTYAKIFRYLAESDFVLPSDFLHLVGFYALTEAENKFFKRFFNNGAMIYWHADPENLPELYRRWLHNWKVEPECIGESTKSKPQFFFFEAHDLHSELKELKKRLPHKITNREPDFQAVVPFAIENVIPLAYHLPDGPVNLTMGYPLKLTGFYVFIVSLFNLVQKKHPELGYRTENLLEFLKTPYLLNMHQLEQKILEYGKPYINKENSLELQLKPDSEALDNKLKYVFEQIIEPVEKAETPEEVASALREIFGTLREQESISVYEKEFLKVFLDNVLPALEDSLFAKEPMEKRGLFSLVEQIMSSMRVPFEGEPLCGLQIMGPLETRLLSFDEVFLLDVNEGVVPGIEEVNPLVPHQIRTALGLPDREREELITRYHFERLIYSAKKVHIFWQFQTIKRGEAGFEGKKIKSRYVEKLLWEEEKKQGAPLDKILDRINFGRSRVEFIPEGLITTDHLKKNQLHKKRVLEMLKNKPVSPTLLQEYTKCPLRFFYQKILNLDRVDIKGEIAHDQLGTAVHDALEKYFRKLTGNRFPKVINKTDLNIDELFEIFKTSVEAQEFYKNLSQERRFILLETARFRLEKFLEHHTEETKIVALEKAFSKFFQVSDKLSVKLYGKADRIDMRTDVYVILDYKTGTFSPPGKNKLLNYERLAQLDFQKYDEESLLMIVDHISDLQLPFYVYLFCESSDTETEIWDRITAAYVDLSKTGEEKFLIRVEEVTKYGNELEEFFSRITPLLIKYLTLHMLESPYWYPTTDERACYYCNYTMVCRFAP